MMHIAVSCNSLYQNKKDGIGVYSSELINALRGLATANVSIQKTDLLQMALSFLNIPLVPAKDINLLHVTDYIVPKIKHIPIIATLHDAVPLQFPDWVNPRARKFKNYFLKSTMRSATHIIALCHAIVPDLIRYWGVTSDKISVVYSGVSSKWFQPLAEENKKKVLQKYQINKKYMLFVGTLQPRKNVNRILQAYELLPDHIKKEFNLILVGQSGWRNEEILTGIKKLEDQGQGKWLQYAPVDDIQALYQGAEFFLFPSLYEGFGLPILEAFASRLPVITSNTSSMPEICGDASLLVNPYAVEEISHAMLRLCENVDLRNQLIEKGVARAEQFTWEKCAKATLQVYQQFII